MTTIVGSGTGANYPIVAGAVSRLEEIPGFKTTELIATSGSCVPFAFMANGRNMKDFLDVAKNISPVDMLRPNWLWPFVPGLFHLDRAKKIMSPHVSRNFAECKIPLTIVAYDSDNLTPFLFSCENTPKHAVTDAMQASMSVPWLMRHVTVDGARLTDGGSVNRFAINIPEHPAVGIRVLGAETKSRKWKWWPSYSMNHLDGMIRAQERAHIAQGLWKKHKFITIDSPLSGMDYHKVDVEKVESLFSLGYWAVDKKLSEGWRP